jgi:hypothetical protein
MHRASSRQFLSALIMCLAIFLPTTNTRAQTSLPVPSLLITWKARTLVPGFYYGKALPSAGSTIEASVAALSDNRLVDLSDYTITWLLNGSKIASDKGLTRITTALNYFGVQRYTLTAFIPDYNSNKLAQAVTIETAVPKLVVSLEGQSKTSNSLLSTVSAVGYFFSAALQRNLDITWTAGGISQSGPTIVIEHELGAPLPIQARATNLLRESEHASRQFVIKLPGA